MVNLNDRTRSSYALFRSFPELAVGTLLKVIKLIRKILRSISVNMCVLYLRINKDPFYTV